MSEQIGGNGDALEQALAAARKEAPPPPADLPAQQPHPQGEHHAEEPAPEPTPRPVGQDTAGTPPAPPVPPAAPPDPAGGRAFIITPSPRPASPVRRAAPGSDEPSHAKGSESPKRSEQGLKDLGQGYGGLVGKAAKAIPWDPERPSEDKPKEGIPAFLSGGHFVSVATDYRKAGPKERENIIAGILQPTPLGRAYSGDAKTNGLRYREATRKLKRILSQASKLEQPQIQELGELVDTYRQTKQELTTDTTKLRKVLNKPGNLAIDLYTKWASRDGPVDPERISRLRRRWGPIITVGAYAVTLAGVGYAMWQNIKSGSSAPPDIPSSPVSPTGTPPAQPGPESPEPSEPGPDATETPEPTATPPESPGPESPPEPPGNTAPPEKSERGEVPGGDEPGANDGGEQDGGGEPEAFEPTEEQLTIERGMGWYAEFEKLGIDKKHWAGLLEEIGPDLQERGLAYWDEGANEWRMNYNEGRFSPDDVKWIHEQAQDYVADQAPEPPAETEPGDSIETEPAEAYLNENGETTISPVTGYKEGTIYHDASLALQREAANLGLPVPFDPRELQQIPGYNEAYHNFVWEVMQDNRYETWEKAKRDYHPGDTLHINKEKANSFLEEVKKLMEAAGHDVSTTSSKKAEGTATAAPEAASPIEVHAGEGNGAVLNHIFHNNKNVPAFVDYLVDHPSQLNGLYPDMTSADLSHYTARERDIPPAPRIYRNGQEFIALDFVEGIQRLMRQFVQQESAEESDSDYVLAA